MAARHPGPDAVETFAAAARTFGPGAAAEKLRLLGPASEAAAASPRAAAALRRALDFVRAYPDDAAVLRAARAAVAALRPAPPVRYPFSWGTVRRLVASAPGLLEIDWDVADTGSAFCDTLDLVVLPGESAGVLDPRTTFRDWFRRVRPSRFPTDLAFFMDLLLRSGVSEPLQSHLYEVCGLPLVWRGPPSCAVEAPPGRDAFRRRPFEREDFPLAPAIRRPLRRVDAGGREWIDVALRALCARELEIYPLLYASESDVAVVDGGGGLRVVLIGLLPEFRSPLETIAFFLVVKNRAPVAYGPVGVSFGSCEMGINLFPEFRGAEIRTIYARVMGALHHLHGAERFWLTRYGMGEGNAEAIDSGAFWFYRKLGFVATEPAVERLAREEEARRARDPSHRSDRAMLRRLSHTEAHLDLSGGRCRPFPLAALAMAESRHVAGRFGGDRALAERRSSAEVARALGLRGVARRGWGLGALATTLSMIPGLAGWSARDRAVLARLVAAKGAPSERDASRLLVAGGRLETALREVAEGNATRR